MNQINAKITLFLQTEEKNKKGKSIDNTEKDVILSM